MTPFTDLGGVFRLVMGLVMFGSVDAGCEEMLIYVREPLHEKGTQELTVGLPGENAQAEGAQLVWFPNQLIRISSPVMAPCTSFLWLIQGCWIMVL